jgi:histidine triad (HIT) family protein
MTVFQRIAAGEIPARIVRDDEEVLAFHDINPQAPVHILITPKRVIPRIGAAADKDGALLGRLLLAARDIARAEGLDQSGYRLVINHGPDGGETVPHLHIHLLGGRPLGWPPG